MLQGQGYYMNQQFDPHFDPHFGSSDSSNFDDMNNMSLNSDSFSSHDVMNNTASSSSFNLNSSFKSHNSNNSEMNHSNASANAHANGGDRIFMSLLNAMMAIRAAEGNLQSSRGDLLQMCRETGLGEDMLLGTLQGVCELLGCYRLTTAISQVSDSEQSRE